MKKFFTSLREHAKNIIDSEKKKNVIVNKRRTKTTYQDTKFCCTCGKRNLTKLSKTINLETIVTKQVIVQHTVFVI